MISMKEILQQTTQNSIGSNIDENGNVIISNFELQPDEYVKDNMIYCSNCHDKRLYVGIDWTGKKVARRCICMCQDNKLKMEEEEERKRKRLLRIEQLKERSLIDERYKHKKFEDLDLSNASFKEAYTRCKKYCEVSNEVLKNGYGIYLWGNSGTGKTLLTSCMANNLIEQEYTVLFTNFFEILKAIRSTFKANAKETDDSVINNIADVDFLFIDDLGTESLSKNDGDNFTQDKIFEIINKRYNKQKPTIFSSNYPIKELVASRNIMYKTVDRINEMANAVIEIKGESYRNKHIKNQVLPF